MTTRFDTAQRRLTEQRRAAAEDTMAGLPCDVVYLDKLTEPKRVAALAKAVDAADLCRTGPRGRAGRRMPPQAIAWRHMPQCRNLMATGVISNGIGLDYPYSS